MLFIINQGLQICFKAEACNMYHVIKRGDLIKLLNQAEGDPLGGSATPCWSVRLYVVLVRGELFYIKHLPLPCIMEVIQLELSLVNAPHSVQQHVFR